MCDDFTLFYIFLFSLFVDFTTLIYRINQNSINMEQHMDTKIINQNIENLKTLLKNTNDYGVSCEWNDW